MEDLIASQRIGSVYGVSSNLEGCQWSVTGKANRYESTSLEEMIRCAEASGGRDHSFRVVQIPLNILELGAVVGSVEQASLLRRASASGVSVMANRPLNAINPPGLNVGDWGRNAESDFLRLVDRSPQPPILRLLHSIMARHLSSYTNNSSNVDGANNEPTLAQLALFTTAAIKNVSVVLCGARREAYARDLQIVSQWQLPPEEAVWALLDELQDAVQEATSAR